MYRSQANCLPMHRGGEKNFSILFLVGREFYGDAPIPELWWNEFDMRNQEKEA